MCVCVCVYVCTCVCVRVCRGSRNYGDRIWEQLTAVGLLGPGLLDGISTNVGCSKAADAMTDMEQKTLLARMTPGHSGI